MKMQQRNRINTRETQIIKQLMNENIESLNKLDAFINGEAEPDYESMKLIQFLIENWICNLQQTIKTDQRDMQIAVGRNLNHKIAAFWIDNKRQKNTSER